MTDDKRERAREATRKWRKNNPDKVRLSNKANYEKNREKKIQSVMDWAKNNKDRYDARMAKWRAENREYVNEKQKRNRYLRKYGVRLEDIPFIVIKQGGCAACGCKEPDDRGWAVDHCHKTNVMRGILCHPCNLALGYVQDDIERLKKLIHYLER